MTAMKLPKKLDSFERVGIELRIEVDEYFARYNKL